MSHLQVRALRKSYSGNVVVDGIDLDLARGAHFLRDDGAREERGEFIVFGFEREHLVGNAEQLRDVAIEMRRDFEDQRGCGELQRTLDDFARIYRRVIDGSSLLRFVGEELVLAIEVDDPKLLDRLAGHARRAVIDEIAP